MASPRQTRLENEYAKIRASFDGHPFITVTPIGVVPPESYTVSYRVPSLRLNDKNQPIESPVTVVEFALPALYPKEKPRAITRVPVFHPNFGDYVCIADYWSPAQSLEDIILEVGEMLQWQKYNINSPLNAVAANWATENEHQLPVGRINLQRQTASTAVKINLSEETR